MKKYITLGEWDEKKRIENWKDSFDERLEKFLGIDIDEIDKPIRGLNPDE